MDLGVNQTWASGTVLKRSASLQEFIQLSERQFPSLSTLQFCCKDQRVWNVGKYPAQFLAFNRCIVMAQRSFPFYDFPVLVWLLMSHVVQAKSFLLFGSLTHDSKESQASKCQHCCANKVPRGPGKRIQASPMSSSSLQGGVRVIIPRSLSF